MPGGEDRHSGEGRGVRKCEDSLAARSWKGFH